MNKLKKFLTLFMSMALLVPTLMVLKPNDVYAKVISGSMPRAGVGVYTIQNVTGATSFSFNYKDVAGGNATHTNIVKFVIKNELGEEIGSFYKKDTHSETGYSIGWNNGHEYKDYDSWSTTGSGVISFKDKYVGSVIYVDFNGSQWNDGWNRAYFNYSIVTVDTPVFSTNFGSGNLTPVNFA